MALYKSLYQRYAICILQSKQTEKQYASCICVGIVLIASTNNLRQSLRLRSKCIDKKSECDRIFE